MRIKPINNQVVIKLVEKPSDAKVSGILIPDIAQNDGFLKGHVQEVGNKVSEVTYGDLVLFHAETLITVSGFNLIPEQGIVAILT